MKNHFPKIGFVFLVCMVATLLSGQAQTLPVTAPGSTVPTVTSNPTVQLVDPTAADKLMRSRTDLQILDVRTPEEVAGGVIGSPTVINWADANFATRAQAELNKTKPVLVYCKAGGRSAQAADVLIAKGFTQVYNLKGGITRWQAEGHAIHE